MRIGLCTAPEGLTAPVDGLAYIEPTVGGLLCPQADEAAFERRLAAAEAAPAPVEAVNCLIPGDLKSTGPDVDESKLDAHIATVCRRAARAGVRTIVFGSGGSRNVPDGFDHDRARGQIVAHLKRWGPLAAEAGIVIVVEPLSRSGCNIVTSVDEGADVVRRADHPNVRLLADTYHMAVDGDPPEAIVRAGGLLTHVHCAEGEGRGPLGARGEDHRPYFRALKDAGYDGRISIEASWDNLEQQLPAAIEELRRQFDSA